MAKNWDGAERPGTYPDARRSSEPPSPSPVGEDGAYLKADGEGHIRPGRPLPNEVTPPAVRPRSGRRFSRGFRHFEC